MIKVGLIGLGGMGMGHRKIYERLMSEGYHVSLVSICDIDENKLSDDTKDSSLNIAINSSDISYEVSKYTGYQEMIEKEELDYVDIVTPTYMHPEMAIYAMERGVHVLCEKPMALDAENAQKMIDTAKATGRKLMIAQCLRFWPAYELLKEAIEENKYGKVISAYFYRGGTFPAWSWNNWLGDESKSGACILDQHVHDVDMINWLFGMPKAVSSIGTRNIRSNGFDAVSTNYIFDNMVVNAQDDWVVSSASYGFKMTYRVNFENALIELNGAGETIVYPKGADSYKAELSSSNGYYREIKYLIESIVNNTPIVISSPVSTMETIKIATAELQSAKAKGEITYL